ncbi:unnamed protein product, partial [Hapterophycus canaliculatus]
RFTGEWKTGVKNGQGVFDAGGSTFEGSFVDGEINGKGSKQWADGRRYEGSFQRGEASGEGHFTSPSGESYTGTWAQNRRHGRGKLMLPRGQGSYVGEFQRHRYHGGGQLVLASGFEYSGQFFGGLPHGLGDVLYPGGSTFKGPFDAGERSGLGGEYVCGLTGICWTGEWAAGKAKGLPSKWAIEPDDADRGFVGEGEGVGRATAPKLGAKAEKDSGGKKGGKASKKVVAEPEVDEAEKPVVAQFSREGAITGLWCRCVRDVQGIPRLPPVPSEHEQDVEEATGPGKPNDYGIVSDESGRTLAITLHEVAESPPGSTGPPFPFFVRRPDLTDVSESLGRFPVDGLITHFQRDERCYPKGATNDGSERLFFVPGQKPAPDSPVEQAKPEPPAKGKNAQAGKARGGSKGESEQIGASGEVAGVEARWQAIRGEVQSNRCLVLRAGENVSLATVPLFLSRQVEIQEEGSANRNTTALGDDGNAVSVENGELVPKKECVVQEGFPGVFHDGGNATSSLERIDSADGRKDPRSMMVRHSHFPFALCLDFRLELGKALLDADDIKRRKLAVGNGDAIGGEETHPPDDKIVRILACGKVGVSAILRLWTPTVTRTNAELSAEKSGSAAAAELASGGVPTAGTTLPTDVSAEDVDINCRGSTEPVSPRSADDCADESSAWYVHSILVRSGTSVLAVPCLDPGERLARVQDPSEGSAEASSASERSEPSSRPGKRALCDLAEWHSLAVVPDPDKGEALLYVDGDELALKQNTDGISAAADGTSREESELLAGGAVVVGGANGEWATLALKNLAVYSKELGGEQLRAITRVFRAWREKQEAAMAADAQEEERWVEEAKRAVEEGREPGEHERPERVAESDPETVLRRKTVRGEAKVDRMVLPKAALEGGDWVLRVKDVSHEQQHGGGSMGRVRHLASAVSTGASMGSTSVATVTSATEEERELFPPLPEEVVKLARAG